MPQLTDDHISAGDFATAGDTTTKTTMITGQQDSRLLKLPGELENKIYELVLHYKAALFIRVEPLYNRNHISYRYHPKPLGLLTVCREVRSDAPSIYYGSNTS